MNNMCKVCNGALYNEPLIEYKNMPRIAQNLPDESSLKFDYGIDIFVYQCSCCNLIQLDIEPVSYYKEVIRSSGFSQEMNNFRSRQFNNFIDKFRLSEKKIIEIGCGNGEYLSIMQKYCNQAYGIEYSDNSIKVCNNQSLQVIQGFVDSINYIIPQINFFRFLF